MAEHHKASTRIQQQEDSEGGIAGMAHGVVDAATDMATQARDKAIEYGQDGYKMALKKSKQFKHTAEGYIQDNPWYAIGVAVGAGLLLGLYLKRSRD